MILAQCAKVAVRRKAGYNWFNELNRIVPDDRFLGSIYFDLYTLTDTQGNQGLAGPRAVLDILTDSIKDTFVSAAAKKTQFTELPSTDGGPRQ
jgi:hypothetical protein